MNIGDNYATSDGGPLVQSTGSGSQRIYIEFEHFLQKAAESVAENGTE